MKVRTKLAIAFTAALTLVLGTVGTAQADDTEVRATGVLGDHTGDARADLLGVDSVGNVLLWASRPDGRMDLRPPVDYGFGDTTALVQYQVNWSGRTDVLIRRSNGQLVKYEAWDMGLGPGYFLHEGNRVGQNWNGIDKIVPINVNRDVSRLIARNRYDGKLYLYDWVLNFDYDRVLVDRGAIGSGWGQMRQIFSVGDMCGDANPDLLAVHTSGILYCYPLDASGRAKEGIRVGHGWNNFATAFSPGDLNGDGARDLVGVRSDGAVFGYRKLGRVWGAAYWLTTIDLNDVRVIG